MNRCIHSARCSEYGVLSKKREGIDDLCYKMDRAKKILCCVVRNEKKKPTYFRVPNLINLWRLKGKISRALEKKGENDPKLNSNDSTHAGQL